MGAPYISRKNSHQKLGNSILHLERDSKTITMLQKSLCKIIEVPNYYRIIDGIIEEIKFSIVLYISDFCGKIFLYDEKNINTKETYYYIILKVKKKQQSNITFLAQCSKNKCVAERFDPKKVVFFLSPELKKFRDF